jgi:hypothetical protein
MSSLDPLMQSVRSPYFFPDIANRPSGGQAFVIKLRPTTERSPSSMLLEPPYTINGTHVDPTLPPRWRQMKCVPFSFLKPVFSFFPRRHACGENPSKLHFSFSHNPLSNADLEVVYMVTRVWTPSGLFDRRTFFNLSSISIPTNILLSQI